VVDRDLYQHPHRTVPPAHALGSIRVGRLHGGGGGRSALLTRPAPLGSPREVGRSAFVAVASPRTAGAPPGGGTGPGGVHAKYPGGFIPSAEDCMEARESPCRPGGGLAGRGRGPVTAPLYRRRRAERRCSVIFTAVQVRRRYWRSGK